MTDRPPGGVLPLQHIRALVASGAIAAKGGIAPDQIQPASLDLRLGRRAWRVRASFLPGAMTVRDRLDAFAMHEIDLAPGAVFETGCVYVVELSWSGWPCPPTFRAPPTPKARPAGSMSSRA